MKTLSFFAIVTVLFLPMDAFAQFRLPGGGRLPDFGQQIKNQIRREVNQHAGRIVDEIDRALGGGGVNVPLPMPVPRPQPLPQPLPYPPMPGPRPLPEPCPPINLDPINTQPQPQPEPEPLPQVESGQVVTLEDGNFGEQPGAVMVKIDSLVMAAELLSWSNDSVEAQLPHLPMAAAAEALVAVVRVDGEIAESISVEMLPPTESAEDVERPIVHAGQEVAIEGEFSEAPGIVQVHIGELALNAEIVDWGPAETTVKVPTFAFTDAVPGKLIIANDDGNIAAELEVEIHPELSEEDSVASSDR